MPKLREETIIPAYEHTAYSWAMHEAIQYYVANLLFSVCVILILHVCWLQTFNIN